MKPSNIVVPVVVVPVVVVIIIGWLLLAQQERTRFGCNGPTGAFGAANWSSSSSSSPSPPRKLDFVSRITPPARLPVVHVIDFVVC